jgi:hypothetical protein
MCGLCITIVACVLALSGGLGSRGRAASEPPSRASSSSDRSAPSDPKSKGKLEFKVVSMGEMETRSGVRLGFTNFSASDGVGLQVFYSAEADPVGATLAFNEEVARAVTVAERENKRDAHGNVVGERAQILVPTTVAIPPFRAVAGLPRPAVIWTDGPTFHEISSGSLQHVLEFEKGYR